MSTGFSRQEYWSGLPFPPPGDLPHPGIEPGSPSLAGRFFTSGANWEVKAVFVRHTPAVHRTQLRLQTDWQSTKCSPAWAVCDRLADSPLLSDTRKGYTWWDTRAGKVRVWVLQLLYSPHPAPEAISQMKLDYGRERNYFISFF